MSSTPDAPPTEKAKRGTTNKNARGGSKARRRRREWLVETYRADKDLPSFPAYLEMPVPIPLGAGEPACRCYRCGVLLTADTLTVDRIKPGCKGGTYRRSNIRPACGPCNSETGGTVRTKARNGQGFSADLVIVDEVHEWAKAVVA